MRNTVRLTGGGGGGGAEAAAVKAQAAPMASKRSVLTMATIVWLLSWCLVGKLLFYPVAAAPTSSASSRTRNSCTLQLYDDDDLELSSFLLPL